MGTTAAVAGASGYAGGELLRLLLAHPDIDLGPICAGTSAGLPVTDLHPHLPQLAERAFSPTTTEELAQADLVFLALPHGESGAVAAALPATTKIVDLGADHRLQDAAAWARYYGGHHRTPWTYGLPELTGQAELIAAAQQVACSGCYAAAVILALAPLIAAGVADPDDVVVVAASGTSGAGRAAKPHLLGTEVMSDLSAYKVGCHQHVPEIKQATGARSLSMTPVLAPMPRGILATVTARPLSSADPRAVLAAAYEDSPFVHVLAVGRQPHTSATLGSNACQLQAVIDEDSGRIVVTSALDNLGKGAAAQAVQCANLMLGLPMATGLSASGVAP